VLGDAPIAIAVVEQPCSNAPCPGETQISLLAETSPIGAAKSSSCFCRRLARLLWGPFYMAERSFRPTIPRHARPLLALSGLRPGWLATS